MSEWGKKKKERKMIPVLELLVHSFLLPRKWIQIDSANWDKINRGQQFQKKNKKNKSTKKEKKKEEALLSGKKLFSWLMIAF